MFRLFASRVVIASLFFVGISSTYCQNNQIGRINYKEVEISSTFLEKINFVGAGMSSFAGGCAANALSPIFFASGVVNGLSAVIDPVHKKSNVALIGINLLWGAANASIGTCGLLFDGHPISLYFFTKAFINFANVGYRCYHFR